MFREYALRTLTYAALKARGLGAQASQHVIKKVADAYTTLHATIRKGNLGPVGGKRRVKAESKPIGFRRDAAQPFDDRCVSWQCDAGTVSIWTVAGRMKNLRFTSSPDQLTTLRTHRRGESDLVHRDGMWFLIATCDIEEKPELEPVDWIGVDRGIVNLATTSDADNFQGRRLLEQHIRYRAQRAGVPVLTVDARYTSQVCPRCGHTERANRSSMDHFHCRRCGLAGPADVVAAVNVRNRARSVWVHVNVPDPIAA